MPAFSLKYQYPYFNTWILTEIPGSTQEIQNPHWYPNIYTAILWSTSENYIHYNSRDPCSNPRIPTETTRSTLEFQDPHWFHTGISRSLLNSKFSHWNSTIHVTIPGSKLEYQDSHSNPHIPTGIPRSTLTHYGPKNSSNTVIQKTHCNPNIHIRN